LNIYIERTEDLFRFANCENNPEVKNVDCKHNMQTKIIFASIQTAPMKIEDEFYYFLRFFVTFIHLHTRIFNGTCCVSPYRIRYVASETIYQRNNVCRKNFYARFVLREMQIDVRKECANKTIRGRMHDGNIYALLFNKITAHCVIPLNIWHIYHERI